MLGSLIASLGAALLYAGTSLFPSSVSAVHDIDQDLDDATLTVVRVYNSTNAPLTIVQGELTRVVPEDSFYMVDTYPYGSSEDHDWDFSIICEESGLMGVYFENAYVEGWFPSYGDYSEGWYLPWWEGNMVLDVYHQSEDYPDDSRATFQRSVHFYCARDNFDKVYVGQVATSNYALGYDVGYDEGYDTGVLASTNVTNRVYFQYNDGSTEGSRSFTLNWYDGDTLVGTQTLDRYTPTILVERPPDKRYRFALSSSDQQNFGISYSAVQNQSFLVLTSDMAVGGSVYLPYWEGSITLTVNSGVHSGDFSTWRFVLDNDEVENVRISYAYSFGYQEGYEAGTAIAARESLQQGYETGWLAGFLAGQDQAYATGYQEGFNAGAEAHASYEVVDFWGLFSGVVSMPFTFFSQGLDWTLFPDSPYEFSVSAFFGTLLVGLMLWKVISLIVGLWGGKA